MKIHINKTYITKKICSINLIDTFEYLSKEEIAEAKKAKKRTDGC